MGTCGIMENFKIISVFKTPIVMNCDTFGIKRHTKSVLYQFPLYSFFGMQINLEKELALFYKFNKIPRIEISKILLQLPDQVAHQ